MVKLEKIKGEVFNNLLHEYKSRGTEFHFKVHKVKIKGRGIKLIGRACSILHDEGLLERRNNPPSPPIYKTNFKQWRNVNDERIR